MVQSAQQQEVRQTGRREQSAERFLVFAAACTTLVTLILISVGGLVTSKGVGMSVPDWPTSYGYNMFLFPPSLWKGGVFDEHVHRLLASAVGFMTFFLALLLQWKGRELVLRRLGWIAFGLVVFQGLLGGLRVVLDRQALLGTTLGTVFGLAHACTGQSFFVLLASITLRLSPFWHSLSGDSSTYRISFRRLQWLRWAIPLATCLVFLQLVLGASMRHQHAGLAIYDFPKAYGHWWPATDAESLFRYNQVRPDENTVTAGQIYLQMFHRIGALATLITVTVCGYAGWKAFSDFVLLRRACLAWIFVLAIQAALGIATVVYNKPADVATGHVAVGAVSLACGTILSLCARRLVRSAPVAEQPSAQWWSAPRTI